MAVRSGRTAPGYRAPVGVEGDLDRNDLHVFLVAVDEGSLAAAGRALGVEHSTVSRRLDALERALGGTLAVRSAQGLTLTELGRRVAEAARVAERAIDEVRAVARAARRVRLAAPSGFARLLAAHLDVLREHDPPIALEIVSGAETLDLAGGDADLALRAAPVADLDLVGRRVATVGWSLYASPDYLQRHPPNDDPADLTGHSIIGFDRWLAESPVGHWLDGWSDRATIVLRSQDMEDAVAAAEGGAGVALVPCFLADVRPLARLTESVLVSRDLWLVARREVRTDDAVRAVHGLVVEGLAAARASLAGM